MNFAAGFVSFHRRRRDCGPAVVGRPGLPPQEESLSRAIERTPL